MDGKVPKILAKMVEAKYVEDVMTFLGVTTMTLSKQHNLQVEKL